MALSQHRVVMVGATPYAHEREAIDVVINELPNTAPYLVWGLLELLDPSTGRLYEVDLLVLGYSALYLVEVKSGPGVYKGDSVDWYRDVPGEKAHYMECPYRLTNHKAKVLASLLQRKLGKNAPRVQPLIFLSHPETKLDLRADGLTAVVTRATVRKALTHHEFPNRDPAWRGDPIAQPVVRDLAKAIEEIGIRKRKGSLYVGAYELGDILEDGPGYQDRLAVHRNTPAIRQRARSYLVPQQTSVERRQSLRRAASREAQLLYELREHPAILRFSDYVEDAPLGPTVLFDAFDGGMRLDAFLRQEPKLPFSTRIDLVAQIGRALAFCHRKEVLHGGLNPEAVLVRRRADDSVEARLFNFQLGSAGDRVEGTVHLSALSAQPWLVYQAPEVRRDPTATSVQSDLFALGALAYFVLTGQPPAPDPTTLDERLAKNGALDPRAADDSIPAGIADVIRNATDATWANRYDNAGEWVELLLEYATSPDAKDEAKLADPLSAQKGDYVTSDLLVTGILGQGATARVLRVERQTDGAELALKVSLSAEHDERIRAEGRALARFRHPRIVELVGEQKVGERAALLLSIAGTRTLQKELLEKGPVVLDYALRWGEDLLLAVEYLESEEITHRDIKPANLGVGSTGKKSTRLTLFDFSLVLSDAREKSVGTAAYRDPFLASREAWDAAADRYSAAVTLHEMLTGVRPAAPQAAEPNAPVVVAAERFDPAIRDRLVRFFEKALAADVSARFSSVEEMRHAWTACFGQPSVPAPAPGEDAGEEDETRPQDALSDEAIAKIAPDAPLAALPLSVRARNALDRAGVIRAKDLLRLPDNRLSAIRGVGRHTAREIYDLRVRWERLAAQTNVSATPFFAGYRGEDLLLATVGLEEAVTRTLGDAGMRTLGAVATAADEHVVELAKRGGFDVETVRSALLREHRRAEERDRPTTLEGWAEALLPAKKKGLRLVRVLFGLLAPADRAPVLDIGASASDVHRAEGSTTAAVYLALGRAKKEWSEHPAMAELVTLVRSIAEAADGATPMMDAAAALANALPHDRTRPSDEVLRDAAALVRVVGELEREAEVPRVVLGRVGQAGLWLCTSTSCVAALRELGQIADALALRVPLASASEAQKELVAVAGETALSALAPDRLAYLAARASTRAACSTRLELYPRGMDAPRALDLTAAVLTAKAGEGLTIEELQRRVSERYPDAEPLPARPKLDALVQAHGLSWSESDGAYVRPGEAAATVHATSYNSVPRHPTALPTEPRAMGPEQIEARDFDERLLRAVEQREVRVLFVNAHMIAPASKRIAERLRVPVRRLDRMLIDAIEARAKTLQVSPDAMHKADAEGPSGKAWRYLIDLASGAASDVLNSLVPAKEPLVLSHLGLVSRFKLQGFVDALATAAKAPDCDAILLVVAAHDAAGLSPIDGLTIPGLLPSHRLRVPRAWVGNEHNAAMAM